MKEKIYARERTCFEFLRAIPSKRKYVVIGGFAVSAFEFPRLSVDLDIVIPEEELKHFKGLITELGFEFSHERSDFDLTYDGRYERYVKSEELPVSVDLLINSVAARQTGYAYSFRYVFRNSENREVFGWHPESKAEVRVPSREMLIALKINAMRAADKRDVIMLCYEMPDADEVALHLKNCPHGIILENLDVLLDISKDLGSDDSIKGVYSISDDVLRKAAKNCEKLVSWLVSVLG